MQKGGAGFFSSPFFSFEFIEDLLLMEKFAWHSLLYFYTTASLFNLRGAGAKKTNLQKDSLLIANFSHTLLPGDANLFCTKRLS